MGNRPEFDLVRDAWLMAHGVATLRIAARDVTANLDETVETIVAACHARLNPLHHAAHGPPPRPGKDMQ